jgi:hypothetical protein
MDPAARFIEAATAPLAETNAELHLAAQDALRERNDPHQTDALRAAANRLEKIKTPALNSSPADPDQDRLSADHCQRSARLSQIQARQQHTQQ